MQQASQYPSVSEFVPIRGLQYHVRRWGPAPSEAQSDLPSLVLMHGWMDVGASYQFVVDAFSDAFRAGRTIIAPDWRGFGLTPAPSPIDHYFFADYLGDLDRLIDHYSPNAPVDLVGHSMGGNVVMLYAGARPDRVRRLVNLEGFGMPGSRPDQAPKRYAKWLDELKALEAGDMALKTYDSLDGVAQRLMKTNPRLPADRASWLAAHWSKPVKQADGSVRYEILGDAAHKVINAQLFRVDEVLAVYEAITAPVLAIEASFDSLAFWWKDKYTLAEYHQRLTHVHDHRIAVVQDAGHMLHHDQPQAVAALLMDFLSPT